MRTWTTQTTINAEPQDVLEALTTVEAIRRWAPVDFDVEELDGDRLVAGSRARVVGRIAGVRVGFDIGATLGIAVGMFLAGLVTFALKGEGMVFSIPTGSLIGFVVAAVVAGTLAAILPARRAARLNVLSALQYE